MHDESELTYGGYLGLQDLLSLQKPRSAPPCHDELQFIIVHQTFELWFKQMLHEVDAIAAHLATDRVLEAERLFRRLRAIVRCFIPALEVIETMVPSDFLAFRDLLKPASGFQSFQFRELEFACGLRDERYVRIFEKDPGVVDRLRARLRQPALWDIVVTHLKRRGFRIATESEQRAAIVAIYRDERQYELRALCEAMIAFDEDFALYRQHHLKMAERMIGRKAGTGEKVAAYALGQAGPMGTHGVEYLQSTLDKRFFPVLWAARTEM
ncbi:MAG: tryptophan 2,3-dioxygenase [Planctomycetes bacterium]|nr:tryptophan 2,3-dioxygenase [Planctomycetota bacterium]